MLNRMVWKRCAECHTGRLVLPNGPCDDRPEEGPYWICGDCNAERWKESATLVRLRLSRHLLYNFTRPEDSLLLLAPLAQEAGGCATTPSQMSPGSCPVTFRSTQDADYQKILRSIRRVSDELNRIKRFDTAGFQPRPEYLREMKRYGILLAQFDDKEGAVDPYTLDEKYWRSFWHGSDR